MSKLPLTIEDPEYHQKFEVFARDMAANLADTLLDTKISKSTAHDVVASFLFNFAMMFDGGGNYRAEGKYRPKLAFDNGLGQLVVPTKETYLHERAYDVVEAVFNVEGRR